MASKLFQRRIKNPAELVQKAHQAFVKLPYESSQEKTVDDISHFVAGLKEAMFGEDNEAFSRENALVIAQMATQSELLSDFVDCLGMLDFETRKDVAQVFGAIMRIQDPKTGVWYGSDYLLTHPDVVPALFDGYDRPEIALVSGQMFRDCVRNDIIAKGILESDIFEELFAKLEVEEFELASDAFLTFKDLLTRHKSVVAHFMVEHYETFLELYNSLLCSQNYVVRRQSAKLLGELLLDRANVKAMMLYVSDVANLRQMMNLLKDNSKSIQFEAFHVFKVFVANPNKSRAIIEILLNNRDKLLRYLEDFQTDRDDEQFQEERQVIIKEIADLQPVPPEQPQGAGEEGVMTSGP